MLALTRKPGQQLMIGDNIVINFVDVQGESVRIAIDAPKEIKIFRGELYAAIIAENKRAAAMNKDVNLSEIEIKKRD